MQTAKVVDVVNDCAYVLSFLDEALGCFPQREEITLSYDARTGLSLILSDLGRRLRASGDAIQNNQQTMEVL